MNKNIYSLVRITDKNIALCENLFFKVFSGAPFNYTWLTPQKARRYCIDLLNTPNFCGFLYMFNDVAAAGCLGTSNDYFNSKFYDIKEIFVDSHIQRSGIGTAMLTEIEAYLAKMGLEAITLFTQKTIPAYNFYLKNNYVEGEDVAYFGKRIGG